VSTGGRASAEDRLARRIAEFWGNGQDPGWPICADAMDDLSEHQKDGVFNATKSRLGFLVGTPGTGKTYCVAQIIKACHLMNLGPIAIAALTGKAAVRCSEMMQANGVKSFATSIHSLLKGKRDGDGWKFMYNRKYTLPYRVVVVDEFSMVDTEIAAALFDACDPGFTRIICVGDPNQLSPVGHGAPLRDLLSLKSYVGNLDQIWRNAGMIVHACRAVRDAQSIPSAEKLNDTDNLSILHSYTSSSSVAKMRALIAKIRKDGIRNPFDDVQVLVPLNSQGPLARELLAKMIQEELNPQRDGKSIGIYRRGDKIICLTNDYYPTADPEVEDYIANGEMGTVTSVMNGEIKADFPQFNAPVRSIIFREKGEQGRSFALGYAITVHKSQGSQWPVVIIIADPNGARVATREWWYTGISRASQRCIIIGDKNVVEAQARKVSLEQRKTFLAEKVVKMMEGESA
jgi:exodeoxyribonuclease V alpha subunit